MKNKLLAILFVSGLTVSASLQGAITIGSKNFTSASAGVPIVTAVGTAADNSTFFAWTGIFTVTPTFSTATAAQIVSAFTTTDSGAIPASTFTGLFGANDTTTLAAYATGFESAQAWTVVTNNAVFANSTLVAVYRLPGQVFTPAVAGAANVQIVASDINNWVYGNKTPVTGQSSVPNGAFTQGIALSAIAPIPEPSAALLGAIGALGLLRRRRN